MVDEQVLPGIRSDLLGLFGGRGRSGRFGRRFRGGRFFGGGRRRRRRRQNAPAGWVKVGVVGALEVAAVLAGAAAAGVPD